ncbi:beta-1,3-galactosyltransferase 5-like [Teleopsis dalmanni]|uniref:beta-1,3-galactosyltransferase 5-like n=1 Tax=Teleopsis dalmanni TaxID=139649 RepID=UPI0018CDDB36|nr:beta-1,3-galactosyltransferase 5-like [Teleopsis dalmanni]
MSVKGLFHRQLLIKLLILSFVCGLFLIIIFHFTTNDINLYKESQHLRSLLRSNNTHHQEYKLAEYDFDYEDFRQRVNYSYLMNLTNFRYLLNSNKCRKDRKQFLAIIVVTSYSAHTDLRMAHRQSMPQCKLEELGFRRIFLLAKIPPTERAITQESLEREHNRFGDLVQGNFVDNYHNLTYKHVMGLRWAGSECENAKFVIKIDDDIIYDIYYTRNYLNELLLKQSQLATSGKLLSGVIFSSGPPVRDEKSKWYVSLKDFPGSVYPYYLSGWFYVTNPLTAKRIAQEAHSTPVFWIDDVWVTGIVRHRLHIHLQSLNHLLTYKKVQLQCCVDDAKKYNYNCDYKIGPNGNEPEFLLKYQNAIEKCYYDGCIPRPANKSVVLTCKE